MIVRHRSPLARSAFAPTFGPFPSFARPFDLDRSFELTASLRDARRRTPVVDAAWHDDTLTLTVDLPGVPADAVDVTVTGRVLALAVRTDELSWNRTITLGAALDPDSVTARHVDGRLTVTVSPVAAIAARRIEVAAAPAPVIESPSDSVDATSPDEPAGDEAADATGEQA